MQLGMVGLGRMGDNIIWRCLVGEYHMVVYDQHAETVQSYVAQDAAGATSIADWISQLNPSRAVWIMLPSGDVTETAVAVPAKVLLASLYARFRSRQEYTYADKLLSAMRYRFGDHVEQPAEG